MHLTKEIQIGDIWKWSNGARIPKVGYYLVLWKKEYVGATRFQCWNLNDHVSCMMTFEREPTQQYQLVCRATSDCTLSKV